MGRNPLTKKAATQRKRLTKPGSEASPILPPPAALDATRLRQLYSTMLGYRLLAERAGIMASQNLLTADAATDTGREAPLVGVLINLEMKDCIACGSRRYAARLVQGVPLRRVLADLCAVRSRGDQTRPASGCAVEMFLPTSFESQLRLALGVAWAFKLNQRPQVAVSLAGDSASRQSIREAVRFSAAHKLPIVHVVETREENESVMQEVETTVSPHALPCFVVDGHDVVAVYRVAQEAIRRARQGHGPALIECRMTTAAAAGADRSVAMPPAGERFDDPLEKMEAHLRSKNLWSDKWKMKLVKRLTRDLDRATALARRGSRSGRAAKRPSPSSSVETNSGRPAAADGTTLIKSAVTGDTGRLAGSRS